MICNYLLTFGTFESFRNNSSCFAYNIASIIFIAIFCSKSKSWRTLDLNWCWMELLTNFFCDHACNFGTYVMLIQLHGTDILLRISLSNHKKAYLIRHSRYPKMIFPVKLSNNMLYEIRFLKLEKNFRYFDY